MSQLEKLRDICIINNHFVLNTYVQLDSEKLETLQK